MNNYNLTTFIHIVNQAVNHIGITNLSRFVDNINNNYSLFDVGHLANWYPAIWFTYPEHFDIVDLYRLSASEYSTLFDPYIVDFEHITLEFVTELASDTFNTFLTTSHLIEFYSVYSVNHIIIHYYHITYQQETVLFIAITNIVDSETIIYYIQDISQY